MKKLRLKVISAIIAILGVLGLTRFWQSPMPLDSTVFNSLYSEPDKVTEGPLKVYHLGHSLVARDMPAMLQQLAGSEHDYRSQLGWGTPLKAHYEDDVEINGFDEENNHPNFQPAFEAMSTGEYDALIVTEMIELQASIDYFDSHLYLHKWANEARAGNPNIRVFLYETWDFLNVADGWLSRLDSDLPDLWEKEILRRALALEDNPKPIYIIPGGQVMAKFVRHIESAGGLHGIDNRNDLFTDDIHFNDYGAYLMALTHYAVLYQRSPIGLPYALLKADGSPAQNPGQELATLMQQIVWEVVTSYDKTGVTLAP